MRISCESTLILISNQMEDHGKIITHFELLFAGRVDHEVIKLILQDCDWNTNIAHAQLACIAFGEEPIPPFEEIQIAQPENSAESGLEDIRNTKNGNYSVLLKDKLPQNSAFVETFSFSTLKQASNTVIKSMLNKMDFIKKLISEKRKILIVMRGLPGSGKSTLAQSLNTNGIVLSTDDYFYDRFQNYNYNPSILSEAHNWNKDRAKFQIFKGVTPIFIDNTNIQIWEFEPYLRLALQNGYYVDILEPETCWKYNCRTLFQKCKHEVPKKKISEMKDRFETNLCIEDVLKRLNLLNNIQDVDIEYCRSLSRNSDPDIVIEEESSSEEEEDCKNETGDSIKIESKGQVPENVFEDLVDNFKKFLTSKDEQPKNLSNITEGFTKEKNDVDSSEDKVEDKIGKPYLISQSGEKNISSCVKDIPKVLLPEISENKNVLSHPENKNVLSQLPDEAMEDWSCINVSELENFCSWNSTLASQKKENNSNTSKPQRFNKYTTAKAVVCTYSSSDESDNEADEDISWEPVNDNVRSWENNSSSESPADQGAIPKRILSNRKLKFRNSSHHPPKINSLPQEMKWKTDNTTDYFLQINSLISNSPSPQIISKIDNFSQYQTSDSTGQNSDLKVINGNPSSFISFPLLDVKENEPLTKTKHVLHKSTTTEDLVDFAEPNHNKSSLQELKNFFPDIPAEDLEDVLEKCDYDIDWTMNILIDSGYKISSDVTYKHQPPDDDDDPIAVETDSRPETHISSTTEDQDTVKSNIYPVLDDFDYEDISSDKDNKYSSGNSSTTSSLLSDNEEEDSAAEGAQYLTMEIDKRFATQLINLFGPISSLNLSTFTKEDCKIVLPLELCHDIYKYWANTLEGKFKHETAILDMFIREDEELAKKLQDEENAAGQKSSSEVENVPTSFKDIVEMQTLESTNLSTFKVKENSCASMLRLQNLQEEFTHVQPSTVEEEYCQQGFQYEATKTVLSYKYGNTKSVPKTVVAPGIVLAEKEKEDSLEEEEEENWEDCSIAVDNPQRYRDEAQLHYMQKRIALQRAQEASQKGMKSVASYYAQLSNMHMLKFKEANERASKKIFDAVNSGKGPNFLDLHLLHVDEALREVQKFLPERRNVIHNLNLTHLVVSVITGKGKHSVRGEARLKPAIRTFLQKEGYEFNEYSGMFKVTIRSQTRK